LQIIRKIVKARNHLVYSEFRAKLNRLKINTEHACTGRVKHMLNGVEGEVSGVQQQLQVLNKYS